MLLITSKVRYRNRKNLVFITVIKSLFMEVGSQKKKVNDYGKIINMITMGSFGPGETLWFHVTLKWEVE